MESNISPRTKFLIENPKLIRAVGSRNAIPQNEIADFSQYVLLQSLLTRDDFDQSRSCISTYSTHFIWWCASQYRKKLKKNLPLFDDLCSDSQKPH